MIRLFAIHAVGNALVLGLAYYWLGIGESSAEIGRASCRERV